MNSKLIDLDFPNELKTSRGFYDRGPERQKISILLEQGFPRPIVIIGERRIGKTSLRHVALTESERHGYVRITPTFTSYSLYGFAKELLSEICQRLKFPIKDTGMFDEQGTFHFNGAAFSDALRRVFQSASNTPVIIDIDEFDYFITQCTVDEGRLVLGFLGSLIDREQYGLPLKVFLTMTHFSGHDRYGYVNTFLQSAERIELEPFKLAHTAEMARSLLIDVLNLPDETVESLHKFSGGHPFFTKLILEYVCENYYLQGTGEISPEVIEDAIAETVERQEPTKISPEMIDNIIQEAVENTYANATLENILSEHMSVQERAVLHKMVEAGGKLNVNQLTPDEAYTANKLAQRHYLKQEAGDYEFNIGYLYPFFERKRQLIAHRQLDLSLRGPLRFKRGRVFRGDQEIDLEEGELSLFIFLLEREDAPLVLSRVIFDHLSAVGCITLSGDNSPEVRKLRVKKLVMKLRRKIEDDPDHPIYLIDVTLGDSSGYRLQNVETD